MELNYFQKNLTEREGKAFVEYLEQKREAIESLLTTFTKDAQLLKISIEKFEKHDAYEVEFCLTLPTKTLVAKEASHTIKKAIDLGKDRIVAQIKKHLAILRKDRSHKSIRDAEVKQESLIEDYVHSSK